MANASEALWLQGKLLSALDGVPTAIKYLLNVRGWPTRKRSLATSGLPIGLQIVGSYLSDALVLRAARAFELM